MTRSRNVADVQANGTGPVPIGVAGKNAVINGGFDIWQRGTSTAVSSANYIYTADRWQFNSSSNNGTVTRQATNDTTNLPFIQYCARVQRDSGQTGLGNLWYYQPFETVNSIQLAGKTVTMSFYARKGANFSATSDVLNFRLYTGTGTDQNFRSGTYTGSATPIDATATLTTTWQRFTATASVASTVTEVTPAIYYTPTGTASTNDYFEITGVQLEVGSQATPFSRNAGTIQGELAACQRYYYVHADNTENTAPIGTGILYTATQLECVVKFPVTMRIRPSLIATSSADLYYFYRNGALDAFNSLTINQYGINSANVYNNTEISGTAGQAGTLLLSTTTAGKMAFNAEL